MRNNMWSWSYSGSSQAASAEGAGYYESLSVELGKIDMVGGDLEEEMALISKNAFVG